MTRAKSLVCGSTVVLGLETIIFSFINLFSRVPTENSHGRNCGRNLRLLALGAIGFAHENGEFARGEILDKMPPETGMSWISRCLKNLDYGEIEHATDRSKPWNASPNAQVARICIPMFTCPLLSKATTSDDFGMTSYVGIAGVGADASILEAGHPRAGIFGYTRVTKMVDI